MIFWLAHYTSFLEYKYFTYISLQGWGQRASLLIGLFPSWVFFWDWTENHCPMGYCKAFRNENSIKEGTVPKHILCLTHKSKLFFLAANMPHRVEAAANQCPVSVCVTVTLMDVLVLWQESRSTTGRAKLHHRCFSLSNQQHRQFLLLLRKRLWGAHKGDMQEAQHQIQLVFLMLITCLS